MADDERQAGVGTDDETVRMGRTVGVGCFSLVIGGVSGGMVGVLVGKMVGAARKCTPIEGLPACDWFTFWAAGAVIGAITLPVLVLMRLRRR